MRKTIQSIVGVLVLAASTTFASPANAQEPISSLVSGNGQLVSRGVAVDVPVTIVCDPGLFITSLRVDLSQRLSERRTATGIGNGGGQRCTGAEQTITVRVQAFSFAFKNGMAEAQASLLVCDEEQSFCDFASSTDEIRLRA
jgi:hypothetical protein